MKKETFILNLHVATNSCDFRADLTEKRWSEGLLG